MPPFAARGLGSAGSKRGTGCPGGFPAATRVPRTTRRPRFPNNRVFAPLLLHCSSVPDCYSVGTEFARTAAVRTSLYRPAARRQKMNRTYDTQLLAYYESIGHVTRLMLRAAQAQDWELLQDAEACCAGLIHRLEAEKHQGAEL